MANINTNSPKNFKKSNKGNNKKQRKGQKTEKKSSELNSLKKQVTEISKYIKRDLYSAGSNLLDANFFYAVC